MCAFVHPFSAECTSSELDLFKIPTTNTAVDTERYTAYKPVASLTSSNWIEFRVAPTDEFIDPATIYLELEIEITQSDGSSLPNAAVEAAPQGQAQPAANLFEKIIPCNSFMSSLFQQLDLYMNNTLVTSSTNLYHYRAYLDNLFYQNKQAKDSHMYTRLWDRDAAARKERIARCYQGKRLKLCGPLHFDLGQQERLLLNHIELVFRLNLSDSGFCFIVEAGTAQRPKFNIRDATLHVEHKKPFADCEAGIMMALAQKPAMYFFNHTQLRHRIVEKGTTSSYLDNLFPSILPRRFIIGFVSSKSFNGDWSADPFEFAHHGLLEIKMLLNGIQLPTPAITQDVSDDDFARSYQLLFQNFAELHSKTDLTITPVDFKSNCTFYCFNLAPQKNLDGGDTVSLIQRGHVRVDYRFKAATDDHLYAIIYAHFPKVIQIQADRTVMVEEV